MQVNISDDKIKALLKEILIELMRENNEEFYKLLVEALEEIGLAKAIREGRKNKFVSEEKILQILEG